MSKTRRASRSIPAMRLPGTGAESAHFCDRRSWIRQSDEWMWIEPDRTALARVYPFDGRWHVLVPGVRVVAGPLGFASADEAQSEAISLYMAGAADDDETRAHVRRLEARDRRALVAAGLIAKQQQDAEGRIAT